MESELFCELEERSGSGTNIGLMRVEMGCLGGLDCEQYNFVQCLRIAMAVTTTKLPLGF